VDRIGGLIIFMTGAIAKGMVKSFKEGLATWVSEKFLKFITTGGTMLPMPEFVKTMQQQTQDEGWNTFREMMMSGVHVGSITIMAPTADPQELADKFVANVNEKWDHLVQQFNGGQK
jgi:hypothetical protein